MRIARSLTLACFLHAGASLFAQSSNPALVSSGYTFLAPLPIAPGQLITLFVQGAGSSLTGPVRAPEGELPTSLANFSVNYRQGNGIRMPILEVRPLSTCISTLLATDRCGQLIAISAQVPAEVQPTCRFCATVYIPAYIEVSENGVPSPLFQVTPWSDQVHVLTYCDIMVSGGGSSGVPANAPCQPLVTHANGTLVSPSTPGLPGEELVAYAIGLGQNRSPDCDRETGRDSGSRDRPAEVGFQLQAECAGRPAGRRRLRDSGLCRNHQGFRGLVPGELPGAGCHSGRSAALRLAVRRRRQRGAIEPDSEHWRSEFLRWRCHLRGDCARRPQITARAAGIMRE